MPEPTKPNPLRFLGLGLELAGAVAVLTLSGVWVDRRWDTGPWCALGGALVGIAGGLYNLVRQAMQMMK